MNKLILSFLCAICFIACDTQKEDKTFSFNKSLKETPHIKGKNGNGDYLYVTAGNMLYSIGNQYGDFPEVGFHVPGEMGGIWQHPIKLMDGFKLSINDTVNKYNLVLDQCNQFTAYPFANQFEYNYPEQGISVTRTDFVPDSLPVFVVEYQIVNNTKDIKEIELSLEINSDLSPVWLGERCGMIDGQDNILESITNNTILIKDSINDWYAGISADADGLKAENDSKNKLKGLGIRANLRLPLLNMQPNEIKTLPYYIGGPT